MFDVCNSISICRYLKGHHEGLVCDITGNFLKFMETIDIKNCFHECHRDCLYYALSQNKKPSNPTEDLVVE